MSRNRNVCHSCRQPGHWFNDCPNKRRCEKCGLGFLKWFECYRTRNAGKLFHTCSACGHFEFDKDATKVQYEEGQSSGCSTNKTEPLDETIELARIMKMLANITKENDVKIKVEITVSTGKTSSDDEDDDGNGKGKGKGKEKIM